MTRSDGRGSFFDRPIARSPDHPIFFSALLAVVVLFAPACGKRGDPQPPVPRGPRAVSDLAVEQEGLDALLTFSYPDRLLTGLPLTDLAAVEIYRLVDPPPALEIGRAHV